MSYVDTRVTYRESEACKGHFFLLTSDLLELKLTAMVAGRNTLFAFQQLAVHVTWKRSSVFWVVYQLIEFISAETINIAICAFSSLEQVKLTSVEVTVH